MPPRRNPAPTTNRALENPTTATTTAMEPERCKKKRTRASTQKVRTGCMTCKIRHVKCDEGKPACMRCINLRLKCEGYRHLQRANCTTSAQSGASCSIIARRIAPNHPLPTFSSHSPKERRAIEFFCQRAVPQLSGYFSSNFWTHCVIQLSQDEPATRNAMLALSRMCEDDLFKRPNVSGSYSEDGFALESYNRAIQSLLSQMHKPERIDVLLMTCTIFICISCLRGEIPLALKHIDGGLKLLAAWRERCADPVQRKSLPPNSTLTFVEETLAPMFAWLRMLATGFAQRSIGGSPSSTEPAQYTITVKTFDTIQESITSLMNIINECMSFVKLMGKKKYIQPITAADKVEQMRLLSLFASWRTKFDSMVEAKKSTWPETTTNGINVIIGSQLAIQLFLNACLSVYESTWNEYKTQFEEIVERFEIVASDRERFPDEPAKGFSFELGTLPALQLVVWKCRYPLIRRKALQLISAAPKRECLYDSRYSYSLYKRIMTLEESSLGLPDGQIPAYNQLPPETALVVLVDPPQLLATHDKKPVNFVTRPYGIQGEWHVRSEYINANGTSSLLKSSTKEIRAAASTPQVQMPAVGRDLVSPTVTVADSGNGITLSDFEKNWSGGR